jgi:P-type Cu+ transporter
MSCGCNQDPCGPAVAAAATSSITALRIRGMTCNHCVQRVTEVLLAVDSVDHAHVQLESATANVTWKQGAPPNPSTLVKAVESAGFGAEVTDGADAGAAAGDSVLARWRFQVVFGAVLTAPLMAGEWIFGVGELDWFKWVGFALAAPVMVVCGRSFFAGAWRQLRQGASNMDTLVALGSSAAFGYSTVGLLLGFQGHLYFMEAAAIITLISAGHWLEALTSTRAAGALRRLMTLAPSTARKRLPDGREAEVDVASLRPGDQVGLRPGDRVPTDGEVIEGESAVDESMLTGESLPVEKAAGSTLYAGTLSQDGRLVMRVTATGETTALARIIAVVQRAQSSRAGIQRLADRVSSVFVPVVVFIALATALFWGLAPDQARSVSGFFERFLWPVHWPATVLAAAIIHATAVLIVACPCAMGLATPAAIMAGTNVAARRGILIRDGQALEKSGNLTAVAFDKTGTLTRGQLSVTAETVFPNSETSCPFAGAALALAGSSQHPVSRAITRWAEQLDPAGAPLPVEAWQERRGQGIEADWSGTALRLGSVRWLLDCGVDLQHGAGFLGEWTAAGATVVGLARGRTLLGLVAVRDELKPHASQVVQSLQAKGLQIFVLTGDQRTTAAAIARSAGIPESNVLAELNPEQKSDAIRELQNRGEKVAFVGDGINDAPALEQANLGIAVARASDVARESADIILLNSDIQAIPEAIGVARATLRTIRQNLFWAFFYNAAAIPLAALGFLSPVVCAVAMGASDLLVIGNALRLNRLKL